MTVTLSKSHTLCECCEEYAANFTVTVDHIDCEMCDDCYFAFLDDVM